MGYISHMVDEREPSDAIKKQKKEIKMLRILKNSEFEELRKKDRESVNHKEYIIIHSYDPRVEHEKEMLEKDLEKIGLEIHSVFLPEVNDSHPMAKEINELKKEIESDTQRTYFVKKNKSGISLQGMGGRIVISLGYNEKSKKLKEKYETLKNNTDPNIQNAIEAIKSGNYRPETNQWGDIVNEFDKKAIQMTCVNASNYAYSDLKELRVYHWILSWDNKRPTKANYIHPDDEKLAEDKKTARELYANYIDSLPLVGVGIKPANYTDETHVTQWLYTAYNMTDKKPHYYLKVEPDTANKFCAIKTKEQVAYDRKSYTIFEKVVIEFFDGNKVEYVLKDFTSKDWEVAPYEGWCEYIDTMESEEEFLSSSIFEKISKNEKITNWWKKRDWNSKK